MCVCVTNLLLLLLFPLLLCRSSRGYNRDSSVSIVTRLGLGQPRKRGSFPGRNKQSRLTHAVPIKHVQGKAETDHSHVFGTKILIAEA